jgi:hypothetical protein
MFNLGGYTADKISELDYIRLGSLCKYDGSANVQENGAFTTHDIAIAAQEE